MSTLTTTPAVGTNASDPAFWDRAVKALDILDDLPADLNSLILQVEVQPLSWIAFQVERNLNLARDTNAPYYKNAPAQWNARVELLQNILTRLHAIL